MELIVNIFFVVFVVYNSEFICINMSAIFYLVVNLLQQVGECTLSQ